ncbi:MAG: septum formation initiator family protein [Lentisphaeria bacterium]|nr:septum formation initiator family protein [Lentisphaeria bacterium]
MKLIFFAILLILSVFTSSILYRNYDSHRKALAELSIIRQNFDDLDSSCRQVNKQIISLENSPAEVERVARESLGWCRDGEDIYHFNHSM